MKKRLTAWILALVLTLCGLVPAALAGDETPPEEAGYYYVALPRVWTASSSLRCPI